MTKGAGSPANILVFFSMMPEMTMAATPDEVGGYRHQRAAAEDSAGKQADDGHFGAAGDEAGGHDGHFAVAVILDGAGRHDAGHAAAGAHQHGDETLAGQAELAEVSGP